MPPFRLGGTLLGERADRIDDARECCGRGSRERNCAALQDGPSSESHAMLLVA
jgi:hypothetical protein